MIFIPVCPDCGKPVDPTIEEEYCEECTARFIDYVLFILGPDRRSELAAQLQQDRQLGIGLDRRLEPEEGL